MSFNVLGNKYTEEKKKEIVKYKKFTRTANGKFENLSVNFL